MHDTVDKHMTGWKHQAERTNHDKISKLELLFRLFNLKPIFPTVWLSGWGRLLDRARKLKWVVQVNWVNVWQRNPPIGGLPGFQLASRKFRQYIRLLWLPTVSDSVLGFMGRISRHSQGQECVQHGGFVVVFLQIMWSCYPPQAMAFSKSWKGFLLSMKWPRWQLAPWNLRPWISARK